MTKFTKTNEVIEGANRIPSKEAHIYVSILEDSSAIYLENSLDEEGAGKEVHWSKYQIKETDMRIKTATFSSPQYLDLTLGKHVVLIASIYHENFSGVILSCEFDEKNQIYNYQCQDWSRNYMMKASYQIVTCRMIHLLRLILVHNKVNKSSKLELTADELNKFSEVLSGLRPVDDYAQERWGSIVKYNPINEFYNLLIKEKPLIEIFRDLIYGCGAYIDLWFNDRGVLQVEPYQKDDFFNTGLHLLKPEAIDNKFKFDVTNILTGATVRNSEDKTDIGKQYWNETLVAFFGYINTTNSSKDVYVALGNTVADTTKSTSSNSTTASNPFKGRKIWINADNGSDSMKNQVANKLKSKGYTVHVGRTCSNCHYEDYSNVGKDYVYITMYNGFCAGTVQEAYSSSIQNKLKNKNVQLVIMFDTQGWTNPQGMKPYRYGDFTGYTAHRAWDDNFSSGDPTIKSVGSWFKNKGAIYCAYPNADGLVEQFEAGGYFKWKENK